MQNRRKETRHPVSIQLSISDLYRQDHIGIHGLDTPIHVEDISRSGLCFVSECILPVDYCFNAKIHLEKSDAPSVFTTVKIKNVEIIDRTFYRYGCEFTTISDDLIRMIDNYTLC